MKIPRPFVFLAALAALLAAAGCANVSLDLATESDPNRVLNGTVNFRTETPLPPDAEVVVRVLDMASLEQARAAANRDLPVATRAQVQLPPTVLAEQTIRAPGAAPVPFRLEFRANDELLRHGLNLEARISYGGKVRFRTVDAYLVTLSSLGRDHELWVAVAGR
jgi:uncharacterized lipoprotein YbaY